LSTLPLLSGYLFAGASTTGQSKIPYLDPALDVTRDEDFWHQIKQAYSVSPTLVNLNNGGVCPQPRVVQEAVEHYNRWSNETPTYYMCVLPEQVRKPCQIL